MTVVVELGDLGHFKDAEVVTGKIVRLMGLDNHEVEYGQGSRQCRDFDETAQNV